MGVVVVGRPTFDVASASEPAARAVAEVRSVHPSAVGDDTVHTTTDQVGAAVAGWPDEIDTVVIVLATFTDSTVPAAAVDGRPRSGPARVVLWSFPEPRVGGRLEWNSLCGAILANHRFRAGSVDVRTIHGLPGAPTSIDRLAAAIGRSPAVAATAPRTADPTGPAPDPVELDRHRVALVDGVVAAMARARVGVIGEPPDGFEPCLVTVGPAPIGARFEPVALDRLFETAADLGPDGGRRPDAVATDRAGGGTPVTVRSRAAALADVESRDAEALERSLRLHDGIRRLAAEHRWDAVAVRCWPECFTHWGGAACAPVAFLGDTGLPAACEADGYGALTSLLLEAVAGRPAFLADLVHLDAEENSFVVWHCGMAPPSMADPHRPIAAIDHPNRGVPLALHFGLAPGPVTMARISQAGGRLRLFAGVGRVVDRPPAFLGTSGTVQLRTPVERLLDQVMDEGLEHHLVLVPGDHRAVLTAVANRWRIPFVPLADPSPPGR